jgi:hypothetical protein
LITIADNESASKSRTTNAGGCRQGTHVLLMTTQVTDVSADK